MRLSVVIITYNALAFLKPCLESLREVLDSPDAELILVDNASSDGTVDYVKQHFPQIRLIELDRNRGISYARNRGIEKAVGEYVLLLDSDTVANREAIDGMVTYMDANPRAGICGCRLLSIDNKIQDSFKKYPSIGYKANNLLIAAAGKLKMKGLVQSLEKRNGRYTYGDPALITSPFSPTYLIGACQMIRRAMIAETGLLDERIFYGPEDADFCLRAAKAGWEVVYLPQFGITHHWQRSTGKKIFSTLTFKHIKALLYFYRKYGCSLHVMSTAAKRSGDI